ncbi:DUF4147 domain-containing protein [Candidatus Wolfebacteria bacterium]|nr:DUF4147 domain-containing protein [Candidatus Wolfebacteria bacterium]
MAIISNLKDLAKNSLREKALEIAEAGYEAIDIEQSIKSRIRIENNFLKITTHPAITSDSSGKLQQKEFIEINFNNFKRIFLVGIGKGSAFASAMLAKILGDKLTGGIVLDKENNNDEYRQILRSFESLPLQIFEGTHPYPSLKNLEATRKIVELAESLDENDLLINFICGGGSALACATEEELTGSQVAIKSLTKAGANIVELNTLRKHLSKIKGGGLAKMACPARVVSLIVSDVCGNDLSVVSSGPTVFDKTTKEDAEDILKKYGLDIKDFHLYETPKEKECFEKVKNILFVCNQDAIMAMAQKAEEFGFSGRIYSLALEGEAMNVIYPMIKEIKNNEALLTAGETTVNLKNRPPGKGGRNMEAVLGALVKLQTMDDDGANLVFMSFASDASDNTEAAGAIGDSLTLKKAKEFSMDPEKFLYDNQAFAFFEKTGDLIFAEKKCFNVADLMLALKASKE